jgi:hypothetical protein
VKVNADLTSVEQQWQLGSHNHNVFFDGTFLYTCDSHNGKLLRMNMDTEEVEEKSIGAFARGLAVTDDLILVGSNTLAERDKRHDGSPAYVTFLRRDTLEFVDSKTFMKCGQLFDIRVIDREDHAHNGIPFPGRIEHVG